MPISVSLVTAEGAGSRPLIANRTAADTWETFDVIDRGSGLVALRSHANNRYVCADAAGSQPLINDRRQVARVRRDLPILLVSGDKDPVGDHGKGVRAVAGQLRSVGVTDVTCTLYPGARHEILNETNRDEVQSDIIAWLDAHLAA